VLLPLLFKSAIDFTPITRHIRFFHFHGVGITKEHSPSYPSNLTLVIYIYVWVPDELGLAWARGHAQIVVVDSSIISS
jgi:hypothetical protein